MSCAQAVALPVAETTKSSTEQMQLLLLRWAHASEGFYGLLLPETTSFAAQQVVVQAVPRRFLLPLRGAGRVQGVAGPRKGLR